MLGAIAQAEHRFDDAAAALERAAEESAALGFLGQAALHRATLARVQQRLGDPRAAASFDQAIRRGAGRRRRPPRRHRPAQPRPAAPRHRRRRPRRSRCWRRTSGGTPPPAVATSRCSAAASSPHAGTTPRAGGGAESSPGQRQPRGRGPRTRRAGPAGGRQRRRRVGDVTRWPSPTSSPRRPVTCSTRVTGSTGTKPVGGWTDGLQLVRREVKDVAVRVGEPDRLHLGTHRGDPVVPLQAVHLERHELDALAA